MMISPIGTLVTQLDGALSAAMDVGVTAMSAYMQRPVWAGTTIVYIAQGVRVYRGDPKPYEEFFPNLVRVCIIIWLVTNVSAYNHWVRGLMYAGISDSLIHSIADSMGATAVTISGGATAIGAVFDRIFAQICQVAGAAIVHAGPWTIIPAALVAAGTTVTCGLALGLDALVYIATNFLLGIMMIVGVVVIALAIPESTRDTAQRWIGKCVSLILMKVCSIIVLQILLTGDQVFMEAVVNALPTIEGLADIETAAAAMVLWFCAGAVVMVSLSAIAYSIGTGVAVSAGNLMVGYFVMRGLFNAGKAGLNMLNSGPGYPTIPNYDLTLPQRQIAAGPQHAALPRPPAALPPPPPPPTPLISR